MYLRHQDVITGDVINILINLSIQQCGQLHQDPPSVGDTFTLKQIRREKSSRKILTCVSALLCPHKANEFVKPFPS